MLRIGMLLLAGTVMVCALPQRPHPAWPWTALNDNKAASGKVSKAADPNYSAIMQQMWNADVNGATNATMRLALQGKTTIKSLADEAPQNLFAFVDEAFLRSRPTVAAFIALLDNYNHVIGTDEVETAEERAEVATFLAAIGETDVMKAALDFLQKQGQPFPAMTDLLQYIKGVWFTLYPRSKNFNNPVDSSGFEHVFLGESKKTRVIGGMHNWIQAYFLEKSGTLDYTGYIDKFTAVAPGRYVFGARLRAYNNYWKNPFSSFIFGSSPEFDFAAYTICFALRVNKPCSFRINGASMNIRTMRYLPGYNYVDTAYPEV